MKQTIDEITAQIQQLKEAYLQEGFEIVGVFGSYARGTADRYSDIDIAYRIDYPMFSKKFKDGFSKILRIEEIKEELERVLRKKVDLISVGSANRRFNEQIDKEMVYV